MLEQVTDAIVLDKEYNGDADARVHLFTRSLGKILVKATSARKITSKLGAHLEPLTISTVRFVQKNHLPQIVDALRKDRLPFDYLPILRLIKNCAPEYEQDLFLWELCSRATNLSLFSDRRIMIRTVLARLGYDPQFAQCEFCGGPSTYFSLDAASFFCGNCLSGAGECVML